MRIPSSTPAPGPKLMSLTSGGTWRGSVSRPPNDWLIEHGFASECGVDYDCDGCAEAGRGRACDEHRFPGIGVSRFPEPQEAAYIDLMGHAPPVSDSPQWTWKKTKNGPSALEVAA